MLGRKGEAAAASFVNDLRTFLQGQRSGARLRGGVLRAALLKNADLTNADLTNADLREADVTGARFNNTILTGAKLVGIVGLPDDELRPKAGK